MGEKPIDLSNIVIPKSVDNAITNLTDKPTKNIGTTFGDLWHLVFGGISFHADKKRIKYQVALEKFEKECREEIDNIPEDKRVEPDTQTAAMALDAAKYCVENETIRKMFAKLIAATMNSDTEGLIHPSFPEILKQMSTLDAQILYKFHFSKQYAICEYRQNLENNRYRTLSTNVFMDEYTTNDIIEFEKRAVAITSLVRCGVLTVDYSRCLFDNSKYDDFNKTELYNEYEKALPVDSSLEIQKGLITITPLGEQLLSICLPDSVDVTPSDANN